MCATKREKKAVSGRQMAVAEQQAFIAITKQVKILRESASGISKSTEQISQPFKVTDSSFEKVKAAQKTAEDAIQQVIIGIENVLSEVHTHLIKIKHK